MAQTVKNPPAMQETRVQSLGQEDPLEKWIAKPTSVGSCLENLMDRGAWQVTSPWDCKESDTTEWLILSLFFQTKVQAAPEGRDFPEGPVVKNLPANTGDMGSIPGPERPHMPQGS